MNRSISDLLVAMFVFLLVFTGAWLSFGVRSHGGYATIIWIPGGIGFTCLVALGLRYWPCIFLATLSYFLLRGLNFPLATWISAGNTIDVWLGAFLLLKFGSARPKLNRLREIFILMASVLAGSLVGSGFVLTGLMIWGKLPQAGIVATGHMWLTSELLGDLVFGGIVFSAWFDGKHCMRLLRQRPIEAALFAFVLVLSCTFVFTKLAVLNRTLLVRPYFMFTLMIWASLRFDIFGAAFLNIVTACAVMIGGLQGYNPVPSFTGDARVTIVQYILLTLGALGLLLGAEEREKRDAIDARNEFLGIASHELKTPITSLKLQLQLFQKKVRSSNPDLNPSLERLGQQMNRLTRIVNLLLDISRVDRGDFSLQPEAVDLSLLIQDVIDRLGPDIARSQCTIEVDVPKGIGGTWDPYRIEQVIENLVSNALKYAPGKTVRISGFSTGSEVQISVVDEGPGIPLARQHLLFERFYRAMEDTNAQGLGLGLYLSRQIVNSHQGHVELVSREGKGTKVVVHLPAAPTKFQSVVGL